MHGQRPHATVVMATASAKPLLADTVAHGIRTSRSRATFKTEVRTHQQNLSEVQLGIASTKNQAEQKNTITKAFLTPACQPAASPSAAST